MLFVDQIVQKSENEENECFLLYPSLIDKIDIKVNILYLQIMHREELQMLI